MAADIIASPPDFSAIGTTFTVFALAIAAIVGGIYKGLKEIKKDNPASRETTQAVFVDSAALRNLSETNRLLYETNTEMRDLARQMVRKMEDMVEALEDHRKIVRSQIEEQHRLRAATEDLVGLMRRQQ